MTPLEAHSSVCLRLFATSCVSLSLIAVTAGARQGDEALPRFAAAALLTPGVLKGPHYRVDDAVRTEGYFHEFSISSDFGPFKAVGRSELAVRIQEVGALAALQDVSKTEVFLSAAGQSVVKVGQSAAAVVTDPAGSVKGMGAGVKRVGVNLGRRTKSAVSSDSDADAASGDEATKKDSASASAAKSVLGVNGAMRRWAQKVGVDPYTTNPVVQKALADIAKVDAAGSIVTKVVVPIPAAVGVPSSIGDLVWSKDPQELQKLNEGGLRELAVREPDAKRLLGNPWFTPTYQTRFVAALRAVKAAGAADYVTTAGEAGTAREALFFVESAEMLQQEHARAPVKGILTDSRAMVALGAGGRARALLPLDWVAWTAATHAALREMSDRTRKELGATGLDLALTGRPSDRARRELTQLGWVVVPAAMLKE
jgi:hypothetical protein